MLDNIKMKRRNRKEKFINIFKYKPIKATRKMNVITMAIISTGDNLAIIGLSIFVIPLNFP